MDNALIPLTPMELAGAPEVPEGDVLLWREEDGLVVLGAERDRRRFLDALGSTTDAAGVAGSVAALSSAGGDYYKLTARARPKLAELRQAVRRERLDVWLRQSPETSSPAT